MPHAIPPHPAAPPPHDVLHGHLPQPARACLCPPIAREHATAIEIVVDIPRRVLPGRRICLVSKRKGARGSLERYLKTELRMQVRYWLLGPERGKKVGCRDEWMTCDLTPVLIGGAYTWALDTCYYMEGRSAHPRGAWLSRFALW
jgi:hypothetical protein